MRYASGQKELTRQKMVDTAALVLRRDGIAAAGVATLMAEAGLTNGAFYAHFDSKEALVAEAVVAALKETAATLARTVAEADEGHRLDALIDRYLDARHAAHPERGCAVTALGPELARRPPETRAAVGAAIDDLIGVIVSALPPGHPDPLAAGRAVFGCMVGTLQLARVAEPSAQADILRGGAAAARLLGRPAG